jgi:predicted dehydrogenase
MEEGSLVEQGERVRVAVVGLGAIGLMAHVPGYLSCPDAEVVAVVDTDPANATAGQRAVEQATGRTVPAFSSLEDLITSQLADAVSIAVPNVFHVPLALQALGAGLHVLVEKPVALTVADAVELGHAAREAGRVLMVGQTHRYRDDVQALKRFVDDGSLGDIYHAEARILRRRGTPTGWFTEMALSGGGPLVDIGVHALDLAWWLMGKPTPAMVLGHVHQGIGNDHPDFVERWTAQMPRNQDNRIYDTEDFATALIRFDTGATLNLTTSWNINGREDDRIIVNLYGSRAGISLEPPAVYSMAHHVLTTTALPVSMGNPHQVEMHHFIDCVRTQHEPMSPVADAIVVTAMLGAIGESSRARDAVRLDGVG